MEFAWIEPGRITMGTLESEIGRGGDEGPPPRTGADEGVLLGKVRGDS